MRFGTFLKESNYFSDEYSDKIEEIKGGVKKLVADIEKFYENVVDKTSEDLKKEKSISSVISTDDLNWLRDTNDKVHKALLTLKDIKK